MDPKIHPLTTVQKLIDKMRPVDAGVYCLYAETQDIHIARCKLVPKDAPVIARLTTVEINVGIDTRIWSRIDARIRILTKQGVLEWDPQKP